MIVVDRVSKTFRLPTERTHTLKERALHPRRRSRHEAFVALKDISFTVGQGEFFGIVGRNGSGKSTLLKCLAGIYGVDTGQIWIKGRLSPFIELGVGFNPDLAAYDNVVTNGIMLGLSPREARARYEDVIEFAELEEFQDLKLKNYSSGMYVRLAFSVAIQVNAELLLIDEVLAVGDASFQQKCFDVFNRLRDEGRTIIFVTHDMGSVIRFCNRAMLLERGNMVTIGEPHEVADHYLELNFDRDGASDGASSADDHLLAAEWTGIVRFGRAIGSVSSRKLNSTRPLRTQRSRSSSRMHGAPRYLSPLHLLMRSVRVDISLESERSSASSSTTV
jgi:ABC-type polysaccharide/polyol phosphate transport system ATPase subunit